MTWINEMLRDWAFWYGMLVALLVGEWCDVHKRPWYVRLGLMIGILSMGIAIIKLYKS